MSRGASSGSRTSVADCAGESRHSKSIEEFANERDGASCSGMSSGSATASVHEAGIDGIESTGDVEGNTDENACSDIDSGSGTASVHEVASEVVGGREIGVGMIKMDSTSDSGTTFVQEDADVDDGSRGGEF